MDQSHMNRQPCGLCYSVLFKGIEVHYCCPCMFLLHLQQRIAFAICFVGSFYSDSQCCCLSFLTVILVDFLFQKEVG